MEKGWLKSNQCGTKESQIPVLPSLKVKKIMEPIRKRHKGLCGRDQTRLVPTTFCLQKNYVVLDVDLLPYHIIFCGHYLRVASIQRQRRSQRGG